MARGTCAGMLSYRRRPVATTGGPLLGL